MKKIKIGLISFAHGHAYSYLNALLSLPEVEIVGLADDVLERIGEAAEKHGLRTFGDYRELLELQPDAVVICSENARHAELTIAAANKGSHVLCEKPLGIGMDEMHEMIGACEANGAQLMTAFPCRYLAAVAQAKEAVDRGDIGDIVAIKGTNRGTAPGGWFVDKKLSGGGALLDHTVHVMDLMNWFIGSEVREVYAYAATLFHEELEVEDAGMIHVKFGNGAFGVIDTSWSRQAPYPTWGDVTMEIIGTRGVISVDGLAQSNELYSNSLASGTLSYWGENMDLGLVRAFVAAIASGEPVPISGEDGIRSAEVALAGYRSLAAGQPVLL
ncbi:Gfo/Idh/MocA family oxidoreductase [Paenibacillus sp. LHD-117]|uniref:Gfo/Idh/MocA family protein n=1 Tax=Paenibacillus sp. LHD-117 TaxID=3071412 RepID=UPI0027E0B8CE|nr:Gfo/Idh/MocA family oxidoreductase [Paenibacillus sp. LHD-117]MDQ6420653.1 Gfo/Idh/MocA family oxidoreductase [Paenibacillus sp. LHD-117]